MPEVGSASLAIIPSFKGFQSNLESGTGKAMSAAGVTGGTAFGDSAGKSAGSKFRSHVKSFAKIAAVGFAAAGAVAFKFAGDSLAEAREAQKVGALTESTIKATGAAAKVTAKQVGDLSNAISKKSGIDDEVIQRGANMLLTFKNIRNEAGKGNKIFNRTTKATADMAAAMAGGSGGEIDLKSASILLGKALNDPVKGLSALTRVGVQFTDQQKAINKALVEGGTLNAMAAFGTKVTAAEFAKIQKDNNATTQETIDLIMGPMSRAQEKLFKHYEEGGHALEAQRNILKEVNSQFKGAAAAQSTEADKLKVAWGNFKEEIGTELIPVMDKLSKFLRTKGIPAAQDFIGWFKKDGVPALKDFGGFVKSTAEHAKDLVGWLNKLPKPAKIAGLAAVVGGIGYGKLRGGNSMGGGGALGGLGRAIGLAKPVPVFVTNPGFGKPGSVPGKKPIPLVPALAVPAAIAAGNAAAIRANKNNGVELGATSPGGSGLTLPKGALDFSEESKKVDTYNKSLGRMNDGWAKVRTQVDDATKSTQIYDRAFDTVPKVWTTVFNSVNLARDTALIRQYGGMLDGLDGRTVETFIKTTRIRNDIGESGDPRFGGFRAHGGSMHPGYSYIVGERGPELVTVGARSEVAPNGGDAGGGRYILEIDGEQFDARVRRVADDRYSANTRHPTGRRR